MSDMIEVKVSELEGAALDWAVAKADGWDFGREFYRVMFSQGYSPSTDWSQGGPLIENYQVEILRAGENVLAKLYGLTNAAGEGRTSLVAACRAIVAAKLGDTVSVPAELLNHA